MVLRTLWSLLGVGDAPPPPPSAAEAEARASFSRPELAALEARLSRYAPHGRPLSRAGLVSLCALDADDDALLLEALWRSLGGGGGAAAAAAAGGPRSPRSHSKDTAGTSSPRAADAGHGGGGKSAAPPGSPRATAAASQGGGGKSAVPPSSPRAAGAGGNGDSHGKGGTGAAGSSGHSSSHVGNGGVERGHLLAGLARAEGRCGARAAADFAFLVLSSAECAGPRGAAPECVARVAAACVRLALRRSGRKGAALELPDAAAALLVAGLFAPDAPGGARHAAATADSFWRYTRALPALSAALCGLLSAPALAAVGDAPPPPPPAPLPEMDEACAGGRPAASVLTHAAAWLLAPVLAPDLRRQWRLLFNSDRNGKSYSTLMGKLSREEGPTLLLLRDARGGVLGGFAPARWEKRGTFFGDASAFVFSLAPEAAVFRATGINANIQWCGDRFAELPNGLGFGGQVSARRRRHARRSLTLSSPAPASSNLQNLNPPANTGRPLLRLCGRRDGPRAVAPRRHVRQPLPVARPGVRRGRGGGVGAGAAARRRGARGGRRARNGPRRPGFRLHGFSRRDQGA